MPCITLYFYNGTACPVPVPLSHMEHAKICLGDLIECCKTEGETPRDYGDGLLFTIEQMEKKLCKASNYKEITEKSVKKAAKAWIKTNPRAQFFGKQTGTPPHHMFVVYWNNIICKLLILKRIPNNENFGFQQIASPQGFVGLNFKFKKDKDVSAKAVLFKTSEN